MAVQTLAGGGPRFAGRNVRGPARPIGSAPPPQIHVLGPPSPMSGNQSPLWEHQRFSARS
jgi:hypothetical protein